MKITEETINKVMSKKIKVVLPLRNVKNASHVMIVVVQLWMKY